MTRTGYTTHQKGSWKWQDRFALNLYIAAPRKSDGTWIWKKAQELNDKVKPWQVGPRLRHGQELSEAELFRLCQL